MRGQDHLEAIVGGEQTAGGVLMLLITPDYPGTNNSTLGRDLGSVYVTMYIPRYYVRYVLRPVNVENWMETCSGIQAAPG